MAKLGILAKKVGMTQIFDDGKLIPVTVLKTDTNYVLQTKTEEKEGYTAIQVGFDQKRESLATKPLLGIFKKAEAPALRFVREFKVDNSADFTVGQKLDLSVLSEVTFVDVTGISKGKGFQGVMKRHNFGGTFKTHGVSRAHRAGGSIGQSSTPAEVFKGTKMAGRMGGDKVTVQNLKIVKIDSENNLVLVKGAVPGNKNGYLVVKPAVKK